MIHLPLLGAASTSFIFFVRSPLAREYFSVGKHVKIYKESLLKNDMVVDSSVLTVTLAIVIGTLAAIVYSLRILVLLERRISRIDKHIEMMAMAIERDEKKELAEEARIEQMLAKKKAAKKRR